jgi:hypothetical protein
MINKIKEFLKPNLGKIVLTIGFGLAAFNFGVIDHYFPCSPYHGSVQPAVLPPSYNDPIFWGPLYKIVGFGYCDLDLYILRFNAISLIPEVNILGLIQLIPGVIYWYLVASVIMFIYSIIKNDFIRKNKSKNQVVANTAGKC